MEITGNYLRPPSLPPRVRILGVPMDCVSMTVAVLTADDMVRTGRQGAIFAINPEKIVMADGNPRLLAALESAALLVCDGIGAMLAARFGGATDVARVTGADLMPELCGLAARRGYKVFLLGARPEVTPQAAQALVETYPELKIAGFQNGYLSPKEREELPERINESGAQLLFVALGSPEQEYWIHANLPKLTTVAVCQGVGGTFDVLAGRVKRAPEAWRRSYLEWLYRFIREPARLNRLPRLLSFAWRVWREGGARTA